MRSRGGRRNERQGWSALVVVGLVTLVIVLASRAGGPARQAGVPPGIGGESFANRDSAPESKARTGTAAARAPLRRPPRVPRNGALEVLPGEGLAPGFLLVDGMRRGALPVRLDAVTPGPHRLHYLTETGIAWESTVTVRSGASETLTIDASVNASMGRLSATSEVLGEDGFRETSGDRVRIDGEARGATPLTVTVSPGWHSVRIDRSGHAPYVTVLEVPRGGARFARASFGAVEPLHIEIVPTLPAPGTARLVLYGSLSGDGPVAGARMAAWILGDPGEDPRRVPMASVSGDPGEFVAVLDLASEPGAANRRYFLEATTLEKDTVTSEILPLLPGPRGAARPAPRTAASGERGGKTPEGAASPATAPAPPDSVSARLVTP